MNINLMIDHTLLAADATSAQYLTLCREAITHQFKSVCVPPNWVDFAASELEGHLPVVCTVVGFPLGYNTSASKAFEAKSAAEQGASEIDMVMPIHLAKEGKFAAIARDVEIVRAAVPDKILKVILETCLLSDAEIAAAAKACESAGANFIKTSTGLGGAGANVHVVELMRASVSAALEIKASGGIRDLETARQMIAAGATRLGTSSGVAIVTGEISSSSY